LVELSTDWVAAVLQLVQHELVLLAAVGIFLLGAEDLLFDLLWLGRSRRVLPGNTLPPLDGTVAVFVPAWRESAVLPATLDAMLAAWSGQDVRIYVGCYPNDAQTIFAISERVAASAPLRLVIGHSAGPSSKAQNLNSIWRAMGADERAEGRRFAAVVLHDAEDRVHRDEITLFRRTLPGAAMVQIPVEPMILAGQGAIAAHYADEFAEAHGKELPMRAALTAGLPAAGVGCAFARQSLVLLALERGEGPFHADSLTEDYELGLVLGSRGGRCRFVDTRAADGSRIAVRSDFPATLEACVRQKSRWIAGIALAGWDRLDWMGGMGARSSAGDKATPRGLTRWMLWRDRRAPIAAIVVLAAYLGLILVGIDQIGAWAGWWEVARIPAALAMLLVVNTLLMLWRLGMRFTFTASIYGWRQGLLAIPRAFVANVIHILAARRALLLYLRQLRTRELVWDKTDHVAVLVPTAAREVP
jgi:bacteriophage N4 adsorption protein B